MELETQIQACFLQLRAEGLALGIDELLDALKLAYAIPSDQLPTLLGMLWCKSLDDHMYFKSAWQNTETSPKPDTEPTLPDDLINPQPSNESSELNSSDMLPGEIDKTEPETIGALPLLVPSRAMSADYAEFKNYYPVSRRFMAYTWRYLKREMPDGPLKQIDFDRTVEIITRQGFYLTPAYRRSVIDHAHLVLLLDHGGSMTPFHHYLRDLVETAYFESTLAQVDIYYFHNVPETSLYFDLYFTQRVALTAIIEDLDENTSVLLVSDAGAARHRNDPIRIIVTEDFLNHLRRNTQSIAWLNPMPRDRWSNTSAQEIEQFVAMFPMNEDGLTQALDVLRGL